MTTIKQQTEQNEKNSFSKFACLSASTKGRKIASEPCPIRTEFQRDRDRIIHCSSFRRLKHKTQVFLSPVGDHYRTRLTHTLEVSQIARTIARALNLNEDLAEAISLGHDLGHTPFGHAGESILNKIRTGGFKHNIQSVRVVDHIENHAAGLNLTYEVKNGIACHSSGKVEAATLEGRIVRIADKIAYINHDIEDAVRAGVLTENDLPYDSIYVLGRTKSERITTLIMSIVENSSDDIRMSAEVYKAHIGLREFMFENVYTNPIAKAEEHKAQEIIRILYEHFLKNVDALPDFYKHIIARSGKERAVVDYVAGMTDQFAIELFKSIYIPKGWTAGV